MNPSANAAEQRRQREAAAAHGHNDNNGAPVLGRGRHLSPSGKQLPGQRSPIHVYDSPYEPGTPDFIRHQQEKQRRLDEKHAMRSADVRSRAGAAADDRTHQGFFTGSAVASHPPRHHTRAPRSPKLSPRNARRGGRGDTRRAGKRRAPADFFPSSQSTAMPSPIVVDDDAVAGGIARQDEAMLDHANDSAIARALQEEEEQRYHQHLNVLSAAQASPPEPHPPWPPAPSHGPTDDELARQLHHELNGPDSDGRSVADRHAIQAALCSEDEDEDDFPHHHHSAFHAAGPAMASSGAAAPSHRGRGSRGSRNGHFADAVADDDLDALDLDALDDVRIPITGEMLAQHTSVTHHYKAPTGPLKECSICMDPLKDGDSVRWLRCTCSFHDACIVQSLRKSTTKCPLCMQDFRPE
eukprot:m.180592 g.180592  ORF g.180592 m.180592 type:complete len:411 (+) comp15043_c0_seq1:33-1265(+)